MATDLTALQAAVKLVADATLDSVKAATDTTAAAKMAEYENLLPDLLTLLPKIGDVPTEAKALAPADYATLLGYLTADLALPNPKAEAVLQATVKLLSDLVTVITPDVEALIAAVKAA